MQNQTLAAGMDNAVDMVRAGLATIEQAAQACGIAARTLQAHLTGSAPASTEAHARVADKLAGSRRKCSRQSHARQRDQRVSSDAGTSATDHFVFYQEGGRWCWQRVTQAGHAVRAGRDGFPCYLDCVADAGKHGWQGTPLTVLAQSDRFLP